MTGSIAADATRLARVLLGAGCGMLLGFAHFGSLWWNTRLYTGGSGIRALAMQVLRLILLAGVLTGLAHLGALPLLAAALGLLVARSLILRRLGRVS